MGLLLTMMRDRLLPPRLLKGLASLAMSGLAAVTLAGLVLGCQPSPARPPSIVLIVIDTLRADHLGCYGYPRPTSPHIDRLAADSVRYAHAYSQAPWTTPSVASLLTSRFPTELGILNEPDRLADHFVLLPEVLAPHGYATGAVVSHYFLGSEWNFNQGFDVFDETNVLGHAGISSPGVTDTALAFVREHQEEPFFLLVHYFDVHYDYVEHPEFPMTDPAYDGPVRSGMVYTELVDSIPTLTPVDVQHLKDLYDSEIAFTDHHLGRFLEGLRELDLYDSSLLVLTADHGEEFLERFTIGHGGTLYNEQIHVPLLLKLPQQAAGGSVVERPVGLIDVYPTALDYLNRWEERWRPGKKVPGKEIDLPEDLQLSGRSLLGSPSGADEGGRNDSALAIDIQPRPRPVFSESSWAKLRSVVDGPLKLIHRTPKEFEYYFFDLEADPAERQNMAARQTELGVAEDFRRLNRKLQAWGKFIERGAVAADEVELDDDLRRELEALGYLQ